MSSSLTIIGGGLAGCEAAWQAAQQGISVQLYEMRPVRQTPAHVTDNLAELVCSNSLGSDLPDRAPGLLKAELRRFGSLILAAAAESAVPAGGALAVDRERFAEIVTERIGSHAHIMLKREEMTHIPDTPTIIASGPLTSDALTEQIAELSGHEHLYFYDALSPIVEVDSINMDIAYRANRYGKGQRSDGDYINCPLDAEQYQRLVTELREAEQITLKKFEQEDEHFFEMCLPVEVLAKRGDKALAFGPMRPVGLINPHTGKRPHAVLQLRQDNLADTLYNLVGFQTNLRWGEQQRVLRLIPGLENATFMRYGMMHRNTYINSPTLLKPTMQFHNRPDLFFAGQIIGVEGYVGNAATGALAGTNAARVMQGQAPIVLPLTSMLGALCHYVTHAEAKNFQPMKANFGLMPPFEPKIRNKRARYQAYADRALRDFEAVLKDMNHITT
ncbi:methylenetetrahydrofolate--tRNA-(uracil(54)-C(5))-methyltransferase (FADH(2)-oxidizing) TrmFO [Anaerolineales bacterium HSG6]|nr:methylenetetrahydrofolate--tRNA-(uracil(54)-C(5))-methyltransferase (FADH(2)-oxidizing) TrmFO [Anaerolineales bacterium HSG6]MDM8529725.1 methylenetetrahydrofolate--tRNA-(uracil(54)-C(5))-methyltransferase (FADH(2)-oxidizing) TrmFO [Anaerolineales bacterium HSG25]